MKAEKTRNALETYRKGLMCSSLGGILEELEQLETKADKWDMVEWAMDNKIEFVECIHSSDEYITNYEWLGSVDLEHLEQLYVERSVE